MRFLGADAPLDGAFAAIQGIPYDRGVSWRAGAAEAPAAIREVSDSIETYSPRTGADLEDLSVHDAGDIDCSGGDAASVMDRIAGATERLARSARLVVSLGGDHSVSIGVAQGLARVHPRLGHVVFDAHADLRAEYDGNPLSHACGTRHMSAMGPTALLGVRSGTREEWTDGAKRLVQMGEDLALTPEARAALSGMPVHVSIDMDVLDAGVLPGTGTPEPGGASFRDLVSAVLDVLRLDVVAVDVVEVAPPLDMSVISSVAGAKMLREAICGRAATLFGR